MTVIVSIITNTLALLKASSNIIFTAQKYLILQRQPAGKRDIELTSYEYPIHFQSILTSERWTLKSIKQLWSKISSTFSKCFHLYSEFWVIFKIKKCKLNFQPFYALLRENNKVKRVQGLWYIIKGTDIESANLHAKKYSN